MAEPVISIGKGRLQITLRGEKAIAAGGGAVRVLLVAWAVILILAPMVTILGVARWMGWF